MYFLPYQRRRTFLSLALIGLLPATFSCTLATPIEPEAIRTQPLTNYEDPWELEMPEGIETESIVNIFLIPGGNVSDLLFSRRNLPRAREIISSGLTRTVRLHRLADNYWLSAEMPPSTVWPLLKRYWTDENVAIALENPTDGKLRSAVISDTQPPIAFELQVESGLRSGSAEIHMRILNAENGVVDSPQLASQRFRSILRHMAQVANITSSMLVQHLDFNAKMVTGVDDRGFPQIELRLGEARAWALLTGAVREIRLDVIGTDSKQRLIEFNYRQELLRQTTWQPRWSDAAWQDKVGLAPIRLPERPNRRPGSTAVAADGKGSGNLAKAYLKLEHQDGITIVRLVDHHLTTNTAFELISQLVQEIQ